MKFKILFINSLIGLLVVISCTQAVPIEVIYTGDSCDCPKKLDYLVNAPPPPHHKEYKPSEYGYKLDVPMQAKAKVTYSFDFMVEEPKIPPPPEEAKWDLYAKIDRMTAHKKDCYAAKEVPKPCSCNQCAVARDYDTRYVSPENSAARYTRSFKHPNSIDNLTPATSQIMAIFLEPLNQTKLGASKSRNKRDISNIFMRPRKTEKRSDRVVKQYNKRLKERPSNKALFAENPKPIRSRSVVAAPSAPVRPLQQLTNFLTQPRFRNKRDIKGEYDLIEKEREQMDLTLPEIIQYLPETLDPNFKRNECYVGQGCQLPDITESTTTTTTTNSAGETTTTTTSTESTDTTQETLTVTNTNKDEQLHGEDKKQEAETDNFISSTHKKRNAADYGDGACPLVFNSYNPNPNSGNIFEPFTGIEAIPRPFVTANNPYGFDPVPQQYVGAPHNPYAPAILDNPPLVGAAYPNPTVQPLSNAQLDQIITEIVNRHSDFIDASSHRGGALVDPVGEQVEQTKALLKNLMGGHLNGLFGEDQRPQYHQVNSHTLPPPPPPPHYHAPAAAPFYQ